ncbi:MAG: ABC transporter permease [Cyanobacteria bacterium]|nr:ABC transporter permease [Cyanobacteriota bacterium]
MLDALWLDLQQSVRSILRAPAFSGVFIITIGLALGATTTTASLLKAIVLPTVSISQPHRLVSISVSDPKTDQPGYIYADTFSAYRNAQHSLSSASMYFARYFRIEAGTAAVDAVTEGVTPGYFDALGVTPALGRLFSEIDDAQAPAIVVSDRFRRRLFGDDAAAVGKSVKVAGSMATIIGVTARGFEGLQLDGGTDIFVPLDLMQTLSGSPRSPLRSRNIIGQLAPGVTLAEMRAELLARWPSVQDATVPPSLSATQQQALRALKVVVEPIASGFSPLRDRYGASIAVLVILSAALLAISGVNLIGLMLVRSLTERHQFAVRLAVGASRGRTVRPTILVGLLLTVAGFVASVPVTLLTTRELGAMLAYGRSTPLLQSMAPSGAVLVIVMTIALLLGLAIGVLPALHAMRSGTTGNLHSGRTVSRSLSGPVRLLLVVQVSLSVILVVGAGLFAKTLSNLRSNYTPVKERNVLFTRITRVPGDRGPISGAYVQALVDDLHRVPGVQAAALSVFFPALFQSGTVPTNRYTRPDSRSGEISALTEYVSPGFFDTFGIARLTGRDFTWTDTGTTEPVVMISESVAVALFGGDDPLGRRLQMLSGSTTKDFQVIGVVADVPFANIREPHQATIFRPILQEPAMAAAPMAHVRFQGDVAAVAKGYTRAVESQGRHFVNVLFTLDAFTDSALLNERMIAWLSTFVSMLVLLLACIGTYSLIAYAVTSRIREVGIRTALGATRTNIIRMIVREGMAVAVPGVAVGLIAALGASALVRSYVYGVDPHDPWAMVASALAFTISIFVVTLFPAMRAARTDPVKALRQL